MSRISGPLLDRIDIQIEVPAIDYRQLKSTVDGESSDSMRQKVEAARAIQTQRFTSVPGCHANGMMSPRLIKRHCVLNEGSEKLLEHAMEELELSARAYHKILKLARTIADLDAAETIAEEHISESIQYRNLDRGLWA